MFIVVVVVVETKEWKPISHSIDMHEMQPIQSSNSNRSTQTNVKRSTKLTTQRSKSKEALPYLRKVGALLRLSFPFFNPRLAF